MQEGFDYTTKLVDQEWFEHNQASKWFEHNTVVKSYFRIGMTTQLN